MEGLLCAEEFLGSPLLQDCAAELDSTLSLGCNVGSVEYGYFLDPIPIQDEEVVMSLFEKEACHMPDTGYVTILLQAENAGSARLRAVDWMFKVHKHWNFHSFTIALAVNYFDRYLASYLINQAKRRFKDWMWQLLAVACLSLAAKMEEVHVPTLQDFQIEGGQHTFDTETIQRMELNVLSSLGWRMKSVTAFAYTDFLVHKLNIEKRNRKSLLNHIAELILGTLSEPAFVDYRPSIIALSATSCAIEEALPLQAEAHKRALFLSFPIQKDILERCHDLMEELIVDPLCASVSIGDVCRETSPASPATVVELSHLKAKFGVIGRCRCNMRTERPPTAIMSDAHNFGCQSLSRKRKIEEVRKEHLDQQETSVRGILTI